MTSEPLAPLGSDVSAPPAPAALAYKGPRPGPPAQEPRAAGEERTQPEDRIHETGPAQARRGGPRLPGPGAARADAGLRAAHPGAHQLGLRGRRAARRGRPRAAGLRALRRLPGGAPAGAEPLRLPGAPARGPGGGAPAGGGGGGGPAARGAHHLRLPGGPRVPAPVPRLRPRPRVPARAAARGHGGGRQPRRGPLHAGHVPRGLRRRGPGHLRVGRQLPPALGARGGGHGGGGHGGCSGGHGGGGGGGGGRLPRGGGRGPRAPGGGGAGEDAPLRVRGAALGRQARGHVHRLQGAGRLRGLRAGLRLGHQAGPHGAAGAGAGAGRGPPGGGRRGRRADPQPPGLVGELPEQPAVLGGLQRGAGLPELLPLRVLHQRPPRPLQEPPPAAVSGGLVQPEVPGHPLHVRGRPAPHQPHAQHGLRHQVHPAVALLLGDARVLPALAEPADALVQVLLPRVAVQRALVAPAPRVDDLRGRGVGPLPLLRGGHGAAALLRGPPVGAAVGAAVRAGRGAGQGGLRGLAARLRPHAAALALRAALHGRPAARQVPGAGHHEPQRLGHVRPPPARRQLPARAAARAVGAAAARRPGAQRGAGGARRLERARARRRGAPPGGRRRRLRGLLGAHARPLLGGRAQGLPAPGRGLPRAGVRMPGRMHGGCREDAHGTPEMPTARPRSYELAGGGLGGVGNVLRASVSLLWGGGTLKILQEDARRMHRTLETPTARPKS